MKSITQRIFLFVSLITVAYHIFGQRSLILDKYIEEAIQNNLTIESQRIQKSRQINRIEQAKKLKGLSVDLATSYLLAEGGRTIDFPIGDLFNPAYGALNQLTMSNSFPTDLENVNTQLTPNNFVDAQLTASLPIINSSIKYNRLIQEELVRLNDLSISISEVDIKYQTRTSYLNYLKSLEARKILEDSEGLLEEVLAFNQKLVKYNKATDEIIYDVRFEIENLKSQKASLDEQNQLAKSLFNLLLNRELNTEIEIDYDLVAGLDLELRTLEELRAKGIASRYEFEQLNASSDINNLNKERIRKEGSPTVGLSGGVGIQTENFNFDGGGPLYTLAVGLNWNLFDNGQRKKRVQELEIEDQLINNNRSQLNQGIKMEVSQAYYGLKSLESKMLAQSSAETSAQRSLDRFQTLYRNDKALLIQLLQAENRLTTSKLNQVLTKFDYLLKRAELQKIIVE